MEETRLSVSGMLSVFPETYGTMQSNPPKSKWNPPRGPSWHSAPTVSVQAPRFYVTVPCMDLRIFQNTSPSPRPPVRLKPEPYLPPLSPAPSTLPGTFFFNSSPPSSLALLGLAWLGDAPTLSHYKGGCKKQSTGQSHATVSGHYDTVT